MNDHLNILFVTQDDPFYVRCFFDEFFKIYPGLKRIRGVVIEKPMGKKSVLDLLKQMFAFYGPIDFFRVGIRYGKAKLLSQVGKSLKKQDWLDLASMCKSYGIEVYRPNDIHCPEFLEQLRQKEIDLIISAAAPTIFRQDLIGLPRLGCINVHHAPLPRYRGMMPNFWQLYHGEKVVGITIHRINVRIDDGEILLQKQLEVQSDESLDQLIKRTKRAGAHFMVEAIELIRRGEIRPRENRPEKGSYFSFPAREDVRKFREMGYRLL